MINKLKIIGKDTEYELGGTTGGGKLYKNTLANSKIFFNYI